MTIRLHPDLMPPTERSAARAEAAAALRSAADLLETPHAWTQGCMARDKRGNPIGQSDPDAVRWCLFGALDLHTRQSTAVSILAERALASVVAPVSIASFNDGCRNAGEVASAARKAAAQLEEA